MSKKGFIRSHQEHFSTLYRLIDFFIILGALLAACQYIGVVINQSVALLGIASASAFKLF